MANLNADKYEVLSFDCYGTIVDWESGILSYLQPVLLGHDAHVLDAFLLEFFAETEPEVQAGGSKYRDVLREVLARLGKRLGFTPTEDALNGFPESIADWKPFADSVAALERLQQRFELVIVSNVDDDLFAHTQAQLGTEFAHVVTAERTGAYKPDLKMFDAALAATGRDASQILHVAQSLFHDIAPARQAGFDTVWIDRHPGADGAARAADVEPDWRFDSLERFADAMLG